jgi:hypothetical protein
VSSFTGGFQERVIMKKLFFRTCLSVLVLSCSALLAPLAFADGAGLEREVEILELERQLAAFGTDFLGADAGAPEVRHLGGGLFSASFPLSQSARAQMLESLSAPQFSPQARRSSLTVLAAGQSPLPPVTPVATSHGVLADNTFPYSYWIISVNVSSQAVTRATTLKLSGPGLKFTKTVNFIYGPNTLSMFFFRPGNGAGRSGIYTLQGTVTGVGSMTTKFFAVDP